MVVLALKRTETGVSLWNQTMQKGWCLYLGSFLLLLVVSVVGFGRTVAAFPSFPAVVSYGSSPRGSASHWFIGTLALAKPQQNKQALTRTTTTTTPSSSPLSSLAPKTAITKKKRPTFSGPKSSPGATKSNNVNFTGPSIETQLYYARDGHAVLRGLLDPKLVTGSLKLKLLKRARDEELLAWRQKVEVAVGVEVADSCHTVSDCQHKLAKHFGTTHHRQAPLPPLPPLPFLQYFNNWRTIPEVEELVKSATLARTAAQLMNVPTVRLYQDSLFWKRPGDGPTPWHVDAKMAPFDTPHMITFWIPLHDILPSQDDDDSSSSSSALVFCSGTHSDFALPYWNPIPKDDDDDDDRDDSSEWFRLEERYGEHSVKDHLPLRVGDATVHSGWTLHCADGMVNGERMALAISYVDGRAPIRRDAAQAILTNYGRGDNEDAWSYKEWINQVPPMMRNFRHELVPIVWPQQRNHQQQQQQQQHSSKGATLKKLYK